METKRLFGERLLQLRKRAGLHQKHLGEALGISENAVGMMERGLRGTSIEKLVLLADYFHVSTDYLLGLTDDPNRSDAPPEEILTVYRTLEPEYQEFILEQVKKLAELLERR